MELKHYMQQICQQIDTAMTTLLPAKQQRPAQLHEAMHYSVFAGGKRIRPILMLASCEAVGGESKQAIPAACAMEMIHTYSLIHDDLPAMDDDDFRRGQPTNHKVYGEATAILAGDALLTQAFIALSAPNPAVDSATQQRVVEIIAQAAGATGMVGGQVVDMESEGKTPDLDTVNFIHRNKTGALILASIQCGALLGGADQKTFEDLTQFGKSAGLAFQIADDILDIVGDQDQLGKDIGSDQERGKATYPAVIGLEASQQKMAELHLDALNTLSKYGSQAEPLRQISEYIINRST